MSKGNIIVVGANQCALAFAHFVASDGFSVTVLEKKEKEQVSYDWCDDIVVAVFSDVGLPRPPAEITYKKRAVSILTPDKSRTIAVPLADREIDIAVKRKPLNDWLSAFAEKSGATIRYGVEVASATCSETAITGVRLVSGEEIRADLVVDCCGVDSVLRSSLPDRFHVPQTYSPEDAFFMRRTFFERPANTERPIQTNKIYLKHLGERGISWCVLSHEEDSADVLVGRLGGLSDETFNNALLDLKAENDIIGDKIVCGGSPLKLPVRRPISRMVANGYALIGDSAYMTIPLIGSGMANGIYAAKYLAEAISSPQGNRFDAQNLYRFQIRYMQKIGGGHAVLDIVKNWFLNGNNKDLNYLLTRCISDEMLQITNGDNPKPPLKEILKALFCILARPALAAKLIGLVRRVLKQSRHVKRLPPEYDDAKLFAWQQRY